MRFLVAVLLMAGCANVDVATTAEAVDMGMGSGTYSESCFDGGCTICTREGCVTCGQLDGVCCPDGACYGVSDDHRQLCSVRAPASLVCTNCGHDGQPCCYLGSCADSLACDVDAGTCS